MAKRRDRYTITGNMSANGRSLVGLTVIDMGPCGYAGVTSNKDGERLRKSDLVYRKFKFENPKEGRALGLHKNLWEFTLSPDQVSVYLTQKTEEET